MLRWWCNLTDIIELLLCHSTPTPTTAYSVMVFVVDILTVDDLDWCRRWYTLPPVPIARWVLLRFRRWCRLHYGDVTIPRCCSIQWYYGIVVRHSYIVVTFTVFVVNCWWWLLTTLFITVITSRYILHPTTYVWFCCLDTHLMQRYGSDLITIVVVDLIWFGDYGVHVVHGDLIPTTPFTMHCCDTFCSLLLCVTHIYLIYVHSYTDLVPFGYVSLPRCWRWSLHTAHYDHILFPLVFTDSLTLLYRYGCSFPLPLLLPPFVVTVGDPVPVGGPVPVPDSFMPPEFPVDGTFLPPLHTFRWNFDLPQSNYYRWLFTDLHGLYLPLTLTHSLPHIAYDTPFQPHCSVLVLILVAVNSIVIISRSLTPLTLRWLNCSQYYIVIRCCWIYVVTDFTFPFVFIYGITGGVDYDEWVNLLIHWAIPFDLTTLFDCPFPLLFRSFYLRCWCTLLLRWLNYSIWFHVTVTPTVIFPVPLVMLTLRPRWLQWLRTLLWFRWQPVTLIYLSLYSIWRTTWHPRHSAYCTAYATFTHSHWRRDLRPTVFVTLPRFPTLLLMPFILVVVPDGGRHLFRVALLLTVIGVRLIPVEVVGVELFTRSLPRLLLVTFLTLLTHLVTLVLTRLHLSDSDYWWW